MANPRKPYSQRPYEDNWAQSTNEWADWVTQALNQLVGQSGVQPPQKGFTALSPHSVDPTTGALATGGGRITSLSTGCSVVAATNTINIYWDGTNSSSPLRIYRDDGSVAGPFPGNVVINGLTSGTWFIYPYFDEATGTVKFVSQSGATGSPPIAYNSALAVNAIAQMFQGRVPLFSNLATTGIVLPGSGSAVKSGGGGGGGGVYVGKSLS
jgi:hypothetical protein